MGFKKIPTAEFTCEPFYLMDKEWMLVTAGDESSCNTMTASWGGLGTLWNKPVATAYVRPTRYTYGFMERNERFSLCFFGKGNYRDALSYLGSHSGRDEDKVKKTGLTPDFSLGAPCFAEASTVIICKKLYFDDLKPENFLDGAIDKKNYPLKDYHRVYIGEVEGIYVK